MSADVTAKSWERVFDAEILERGRRYFHENKVENYEENDKTIAASVRGTQTYSVYVRLNDRGGITDADCDCSYADSGYYCKHIAATMYKYETKNHSQSVTPLKFSDLDTVKNEIKRIRRRYLGRYGFIEYWAARRFAAEMMEFLDIEARQFIDHDEPEKAFELANFILDRICNTPMDDDGEIMETADAVSLVWYELYEKGDSKIRKTMFEWFMAQLTKLGSDKTSFPDVVEEFVMANFDGESELNQKIKYCDKMIKKCQNGEIEFGGSRWPIYKAKFLQQLGRPNDEIRAHFVSWADDKEVLTYYASWLIGECRYNEAREILENEMAKSGDESSFQICRYGELLDKIYETIGDIESRKRNLRKMLSHHIGEDKELYDKLKKIYDKDEWERIRGDVIENLSRHYDKSYYYFKEKMYDKLLEKIKKNPSLYDLWNYSEKIAKKYPSEITKIYASALEKEAPNTFNREQYRSLMKHLYRLSRLSDSGRDSAASLATEWRDEYRNRRAMMDELNKIAIT